MWKVGTFCPRSEGQKSSFVLTTFNRKGYENKKSDHLRENSLDLLTNSLKKDIEIRESTCGY